MITMVSAENIAKSKNATLIILIIAVVWLADTNRNLSQTNTDLQNTNTTQSNLHAAEIRSKDSIIYNCQQQQKIDADNATKSAQLQAQEYKGLWMEYVNIKTEAQRKNVIP